MNNQRKRVLSNSFALPQNQPKAIRSKSVKFQENMSETQGSGFKGQKLSLPKFIQNTILSSNEIISKKDKGYEWDEPKTQEKRKIKGTKSKIKWKNQQLKIWIIIRIIFPTSYLPVHQEDCFIEIDSTNIEIKLNEQKKIQKKLQIALNEAKEEKGTSFEELLWLKKLLLQSHNIFIRQQFAKRPRSNQGKALKRNKINENYIMYHSPVSFAWSPHDFICLTQNKMTSLTEPLIGSPNSYKKLLHNSYKNNRNWAQIYDNEELMMVDEKKEDEDCVQYFNWDTKEEIEFAILKNEKDYDYFQSEIQETQQLQIPQQSKKLAEYKMQTLTCVEPKLESACRQYFTIPQEIDFHRQDKLKLFIINNQIRHFQTSIVILFERIKQNEDRGKNIVQIFLANQSKELSFPSTIQENTVIRYTHTIKDLLRWKIKQKSFNSKLYYFFKCICMENQHFHLLLEQFMMNQFKNFNAKQQLISNLGSYINFDEFESEKFLLSLIKAYMNSKKQLQSKQAFVFSTTYLRPINFSWLLSKNERKQFFNKIIPVLSIKDSSSNIFTYKLIKRVLITNSKIIHFKSMMDSLIQKVTENKNNFITNLLKSYEKYKKQNKEKKNIRKMFYIFCQICGNKQKMFQFPQNIIQIRKCPRCKYTKTE